MSDLEPGRSETGACCSNNPAIPAQGRIVDGYTVSHVVMAQSLDEIADTLRMARDAGEVVIPWGGGTMMGLGNSPAAAAVALDLTALNQVVSYEPDDLTIAVQTGCRIGELNRLLGTHGQMLPFDAASPNEATIGGLYATAISGPRRFGYGSMRDLVIGITSMSPDGEISRGGGLVVKNVSGYDMMRLHYGALGSLGVITQLNFKVLPAPRASRTVAVRAASLATAFELVMAIRSSPLQPTAMALLDARSASSTDLRPGPWTLLLRVDGPEQSVERQAERITKVASPGAVDHDTFADGQSDQIWQAANQQLSARTYESAIRLRIGSAPSEAEPVIRELQAVAERRSLEATIMADVGNGQIFASVDAAGADPGLLRAVWGEALGLGRHATLLSAPVSVKAGTDVFGREPAGFQFMQSLKQQFDPAGVLNRGRFIGHL